MNKLLTIMTNALHVMQRSYKAKKVFLLIYNASLSLRSMGLMAVSKIIKQEGVYKLL